MKKFILFLISILWGSATRADNDWEKMKLSGHVKQIDEVLLDASEQNKEKIYQIDKYIFNAKGYLVEKQFLHPDNSWHKKITIYDNNKRKIREKTFNSNNELYFQKVLNNNVDGYLVSMLSFDGSNNPSGLDCKYFYDKLGYLIEERWFENRSLFERRTFKNNATGMVVEEKLYDSKDRLHEYYFYKYNKEGNKIVTEVFEPSGSVRAKYTYQYDFDGRGNWTAQITLLNDVPITVKKRDIIYFDD